LIGGNTRVVVPLPTCDFGGVRVVVSMIERISWRAQRQLLPTVILSLSKDLWTCSSVIALNSKAK
jgi:hypothetical protein